MQIHIEHDDKRSSRIQSGPRESHHWKTTPKAGANRNVSNESPRKKCHRLWQKNFRSTQQCTWCSNRATDEYMAEEWQLKDDSETVKHGNIGTDLKEGPKEDPEKYLQTSFLSHRMIVLEAVITELVDREHKNNENYLGFQSTAGRETAIVRHLDTGQTLRHAAVLDLNSEYNQVPRDTFMSKAERW